MTTQARQDFIALLEKLTPEQQQLVLDYVQSMVNIEQVDASTTLTITKKVPPTLSPPPVNYSAKDYYGMLAGTTIIEDMKDISSERL